MTWESRLAAEMARLEDLEEEARGAFAGERELEVAERARAEYAQVRLAARLMAARDEEVGLRVRGAGELRGRLTRLGEGWCRLTSPGGDHVVRLAAVVVATGLPSGAVPPEAWDLTSRLGLGAALRSLAEDGRECTVWGVDGWSAGGLLARIGHDFLELRTGRPPEPVVVSFAGTAAVGVRPG